MDEWLAYGLIRDVTRLSRLRLKRFRLSIDDFGTGHSSLAQLRDLPFDELKVDRSFVHGAVADQTLQALCNASVRMAHQLRLQVVEKSGRAIGFPSRTQFRTGLSGEFDVGLGMKAAGDLGDFRPTGFFGKMALDLRAGRASQRRRPSSSRRSARVRRIALCHSLVLNAKSRC